MTNPFTSNPNQSKSVVFLKRELSAKGGLEKYFCFLKEAFESRGYPVQVLSDQSFFLPKISSALKIYQFDRKCNQWLQKYSPTIVFGLDRNSYQTHIRAGNGCHAAYLTHRKKLEGNLTYYRCLINPLHRVLLHIEKKSFEHPLLQKLFTNSQMVKNDILHFYDVDPEKIKVIHNGVEWESYEKAFQSWPQKKEVLLKKYHLNQEDFQLLFVGSGFRRKGLEFLLKALSLFPQKNYHLCVIGKDKHLAHYKKLASKLKVSVRFLGLQKNILDFYSLADATIIPSVYDPFANVTLESLSMGVPVVSSKTNGGSEIIDKNRGWVIEDLYDVDAFYTALTQAMKCFKNSQIAKNIRQSVQKYEISSVLDHLIDETIQ